MRRKSFFDKLVKLETGPLCKKIGDRPRTKGLNGVNLNEGLNGVGLNGVKSAFDPY